MKNKIVLSYRFIILVYYLLAFLIIIMNINHLERVLIYSLILIVLFGIVMSIYIMSIPKLLLKSEYIEKNLSTVKEAIDKIHNKSINDSLITIYIFLLEISNYKEEYQNFVEQNSKRIVLTKMISIFPCGTQSIFIRVSFVRQKSPLPRAGKGSPPEMPRQT